MIEKSWAKDGKLDQAIRQVQTQEKDPYTIVQEVLAPLASLLDRD